MNDHWIFFFVWTNHWPQTQNHILFSRYRYSFGGTFLDRGGPGGNSSEKDFDPTAGEYQDYDVINVVSDPLGGAAGSAYVEENLRPPQYRILKYDKKANNTYFQVDHRYH